MRYFAYYDNTGSLERICARNGGSGGVEITETEYNVLLVEIREKALLVDRVYAGEITIDSVPKEWRDEIQNRVDDRIERENDDEMDGNVYLPGTVGAVWEQMD